LSVESSASELGAEVLEALLESRQLVLHDAAPDATGQRVYDHGQQQKVPVQLIPALLRCEQLVAQTLLLLQTQLRAQLLRRLRLRTRGELALRRCRLPVTHARWHQPKILASTTQRKYFYSIGAGNFLLFKFMATINLVS
jgi:hypothetical protein